MLVIILFVIATIALLGLLQWARSGAGLWESASLRRRKESLEYEERQVAEAKIERLDRETDRRLKTSFKIFASLMVAAWLALGAIIVLRFLGMEGWLKNRLAHVSSRAHSYWSGGNPQSTPERRQKLREMGAGLRK